MNKPEAFFVHMVVNAWSNELKATSELLSTLSDEQLMREVAPGRNRGTYILGHLVAEHDMMLPLLRFQASMYPELKPVFVDTADRALSPLPATAQLHAQWREVNDALKRHMESLSAEEWFTRHANISAEDFPKEPHRNRLNVLLSRTVHLAHHHGQLVLLAAR